MLYTSAVHSHIRNPTLKRKKTLLGQAIVVASLGLHASLAAAGMCPMQVTGTIDGSCNIVATMGTMVTSTGSIAAAKGTRDYAIRIYASEGLTLTNFGNVLGNPPGPGSGTGIGVLSMDDFNGSIINHSITNPRITAAQIYGSRTGIQIIGNFVGSNDANNIIDNYGTISAGISPLNPEFSSARTARGITIYAVEEGSTILNRVSGLISANADDAITVKSEYLAGNFTNDGQIAAVGVLATGLDIGYLAGNLTNHGQIVVTGNSAMSLPNTVTGLDIEYLLGNFTNYGRITATGNWALGLGISNLSGNFTNHGQITAIGDKEGAVGLWIHNELSDAVITNHGTIAASSGDYAVMIYGGTGILMNAKTGILTGGLYMVGAVDIVNSGQIHLTLGDTAYTSYTEGNYQGDDGAVIIDTLNREQYSSWRVEGVFQGSTLIVNVLEDADLVTGDILKSVLSSGTLLTADWAVSSSHSRYHFDPLVNDNALDLEVTVLP